MNRRRYFEIEEDPKLTEDTKNILHKIQEHIEIIDFWHTRKNAADHFIEQNNRKIRKLNEKLRKSFQNEI